MIKWVTINKSLLSWLILKADAVDTVPLVGRRREAFALEDMAEV